MSASYTRVLSPSLAQRSALRLHARQLLQAAPELRLRPESDHPRPDLTGSGPWRTADCQHHRASADSSISRDPETGSAATKSSTRSAGCARRHTIKAGFDFQRASSFNFQNPPPIRGTFNFDGRYSGHPFADFLLGVTSGTGRVSKNVEAEPANSRYAWFVQDDWNALPNLTLNLGLRYEYEGLFKNSRGDMANFYPDLGKVVVLQGTADPRLMSVLPIVEGSSVESRRE